MKHRNADNEIQLHYIAMTIGNYEMLLLVLKKLNPNEDIEY